MIPLATKTYSIGGDSLHRVTPFSLEKLGSTTPKFLPRDDPLILKAMSKQVKTLGGNVDFYQVWYCLICPQCDRLIAASHSSEKDMIPHLGCCKKECKCGARIYLRNHGMCVDCHERIECLTFLPVPVQVKFEYELATYKR